LKFLRQLTELLIYSNLFITACALLMVEQSARLLTGLPPDRHYLAFVCFSTLASYSFHYYLTVKSVHPTPRLEWIRRFRFIHVIFFFIGVAGAAWAGWLLREHLLWLIPAVIATFLYSAPKIPHRFFHVLRKVAIGKTIFLAFIWMYVTTTLPVIISPQPWTNAHTLFMISRFFFIYAICILFDYIYRE
jgi:hypothetical protein